MHRLLFALLSSFLLLYCSNVADPITDDLMKLTNPIDKKDYLEKVHKDHQGLTPNLPLDIAAINEKKVGTYLELFGYPKKAEVGAIAAQTPWLVIHESRSENRLDIRTKYFPILFKAYLNGDITDSQMISFLKRFHEYKFGELFKGKDVFDPKDEINTLIGLLNLETSMN